MNNKKWGLKVEPPKASDFLIPIEDGSPLGNFLNIMENNKFLINCACEGDGYLTVCAFEFSEEGYPTELYFHIDGHEMSRWRDRLKTAWRIIRYGECENNGILLDKQRVQEMIDYLESKKNKLR